ncbi:MAG: SIS domain-containing protein [Saprospiraceae bacterium]|nr:SIS domain-containing protein [Saprospiraceae bacterium]
MKTYIKSKLKESISIKEEILNDENVISEILNQTNILVETLKSGNRIFLCGNGGSAADAQHIAAELSGRFYKDRRALPAEALHVNSSFTTAIGNDYGFDHIYARALEAQGRKGDVLIAISTSGNSQNVINAIELALKSEIQVLGWTGKSGGKMNAVCKNILKIPSDDTPRIQECHIFVGHLMCEQIENVLFE